jgi:hypothetical protein
MSSSSFNGGEAIVATKREKKSVCESVLLRENELVFGRKERGVCEGI